MEKNYNRRSNGKRWQIILTRILVLCMLLPCMHVQAFAATQTLSNGYYMIQSGNSSSRVLDINNWNLNNGGNLEIYQKNQTTNQIYYIQYVKSEWNWKWAQNTQYYTIRCLHSGKYIHTADQRYTNSNVHQWSGSNTDNALWGIRSAGNGFYYFMNKASGACLDNSGGNTTNGNNVITYSWNKSYAQQWKPISVSRPILGGNISNFVALSGDYTASETKTVSGDAKMNYPITKAVVGIFNASGKYVSGKYIYPNYINFSFKHTFNFSGLSKGQYYYKVIMWDVWGNVTNTSARYFNITDGSKPSSYKGSYTGTPQVGSYKGVNFYVFSQRDKKWKSEPYLKGDTNGDGKLENATIGTSACHLLSLVNGTYWLTGRFLNPVTLARYAIKKGYRKNGSINMKGLYNDVANSKGSLIKYTGYTGYDDRFVNLKKHLKKGEIAIGGGMGHVMAVVAYDSKTNKYLVLDSYPSEKRGTSAKWYIWKSTSQMTGKFGFTYFHFIGRR